MQTYNCKPSTYLLHLGIDFSTDSPALACGTTTIQGN